jgi:ABC-type multidrug transport system ATPase subunit
VIVTSGLTKRYGTLLVVDGVNLDVREGDRYGFLGPNGSGKTTVVRMLLGLVYATSGSIEVLGRPVPRQVSAVLPRIGALVEAPGAYGHLSGRANLAMIDAAGSPWPGRRRDRRRRIGEALDRVGLGGIDDRPVRKYSLGMRQRLGLAAALLRSPRLLILDEPTNGLDPRGIHEVRTLLAELNAAGTTVFMSSHQLSEVEQLCTRVGVIDRGRLVLQDDLAVLRGPTGRVVVHTPDADRAVAVLGGRVAERDGDRLVVAGADPAGVNAQLTAAGLRVTEIWPERRSLEELVLSVTTGSSDRFDGADRVHRRQAASGAGPTAPGGMAAGDSAAESADPTAAGAGAADGDTAVESADVTAAGETAATGDAAAGSGDSAAGR